MTINKPKSVFKASDGSEHKTEEAATRHNAFLGAAEVFNSAARTLQRQLAENAKTADDEWFEFGYRDYWYVTETYGVFPRLVRVTVYQHSAMIDFDRYDDTPKLVVRFQEEGRDRPAYTIPVHRLYAKKGNALIAHIAACEKYLEETRLDVERVKKGER